MDVDVKRLGMNTINGIVIYVFNAFMVSTVLKFALLVPL